MPIQPPLRIALVTTFYPPYNFGGDGIYVQRFARALARRGHEVTVIHSTNAFHTLSPKPVTSVLNQDADIRIVPIETKFNKLETLANHQLGRAFFSEKDLKDTLEREAYDVIHYHNISLIGGPKVLSYGNAIKLYTAHEHWLVCPSHDLWRYNRELCTGPECIRCQIHHWRPPQFWRYTKYFEESLRHIDTFIALSETSAQNHKNFSFKHEMKVLPSFLPEAGHASGNSQHPNDDRAYVFFAGRLEQEKGLQEIIPLFDKNAPTDLLIAGDGRYKKHLEALVPPNGKVRFLGHIDHDDIKAYFEFATAVVTPSVCYEVFPMVVLEAFRVGTPIIARNMGAYKEIIEKAGVGFLFDKAQDVLTHLSALLESKSLRDDIDQRTRLAFRENWSEDVAMREYFNLIQEIADKKGISLASNTQNVKH